MTDYKIHWDAALRMYFIYQYPNTLLMGLGPYVTEEEAVAVVKQLRSNGLPKKAQSHFILVP